MESSYKATLTPLALTRKASASFVRTDSLYPTTPNGLASPEHHRQISLSVPSLRYQAQRRSEEALLLSPSCSTLRFRRQTRSDSHILMPKSADRSINDLSSPTRQGKQYQRLMSLKLPPLSLAPTSDRRTRPNLPPILLRDGHDGQQLSPFADYHHRAGSESARYHPYARRSLTGDQQLNWSASPTATSTCSSMANYTPPLSPTRSRTSSLRSTSSYASEKSYFPSFDQSPSRSSSVYQHDLLYFPAISKPSSPASVRTRSSSVYFPSDDSAHARTLSQPIPDQCECQGPNSLGVTLDVTPMATSDQPKFRHFDLRGRQSKVEPDYLPKCPRTPTDSFKAQPRRQSRYESIDPQSLERINFQYSDRFQHPGQRRSASKSSSIRPLFHADTRDYRFTPPVQDLSSLDKLFSDSEDEPILTRNHFNRPPSPNAEIQINYNPAEVREDGVTGEIFEDTAILGTPLLHIRSAQEDGEVLCQLKSTTHQCFRIVDGKWACYRRNYLKIDSTFDLIDRDGYSVNQRNLYFRDGPRSLTVARFALQLSSHVVMPNEENHSGSQHEVPLIQFGPARERGPRGAVQPLPLVPGGELTTDSTENEQRAISNQSVAAFRRVQIRSATLNNGQRGSSGQQFYALKLTLLAYPESRSNSLADGREVCSLVSQPITVRGRSKMHYAPQSKPISRKQSTGERKRRASIQQQTQGSGTQRVEGYGHQQCTQLFRPSYNIDNADDKTLVQALPASHVDTRAALLAESCTRDAASVMDIQSVL